MSQLFPERFALEKLKGARATQLAKREDAFQQLVGDGLITVAGHRASVAPTKGQDGSIDVFAEWLSQQLSSGPPALVGIDHAFSFPLRYSEMHRLPPDWPAFLDDFHKHWPTDGDNTYVCFVRDGVCGQGAIRQGYASWIRLTEQRTATAKSVFRFDVQGQVATATHAGLPWLRSIRQRCGDRVHFWPFDGWGIPAGRSVVAEVYPSLWMKRFPDEHRNADQQAAYAV
ncbi:MAG: hypothetical protein KGS61_16325, partial [Verrucomicrobia bacterium]|nr:hypothetical protein [Verrucomicrobiota bacterium]